MRCSRALFPGMNTLPSRCSTGSSRGLTISVASATSCWRREAAAGTGWSPGQPLPSFNTPVRAGAGGHTMKPAQTLRERLGEGPGSERPTRWVTSGRAERRVLWGTGGHLARLRSRGPEGRGPRRESRTSEAVPGGAAHLGHPGQRNWSGEQRQDKKEVPPSLEKRQDTRNLPGASSCKGSPGRQRDP